MAKVINTTKGVFLVVENGELKFKEKRGILHVYHYKCLVDWIHRIKMSEITEEQASELVERDSIGFGSFIKKTYKLTLTDLLESHDIKITPNTYIFKL